MRAAVGSLVKVEGVAPDCGTQVDGSGFVYATGPGDDERARRRRRREPGRARRAAPAAPWRARVVYLDPRVDVAVLEVPGLVGPRPRLLHVRRAAATLRSSPASRVAARSRRRAARVRGRISARGTDIYGNGVVIRDIYSVRGTVRPGNSGGPLLSARGTGLRRGVRRRRSTTPTPATR